MALTQMCLTRGVISSLGGLVRLRDWTSYHVALQCRSLSVFPIDMKIYSVFLVLVRSPNDKTYLDDKVKHGNPQCVEFVAPVCASTFGYPSGSLLEMCYVPTT